MAANRSIPTAGRGLRGGRGRGGPQPRPQGRVSQSVLLGPLSLTSIFVSAFVWVCWLLTAAPVAFCFIAASGSIGVPRPAVGPYSPVLGACSLGHWITREAPLSFSLVCFRCKGVGVFALQRGSNFLPG